MVAVIEFPDENTIKKMISSSEFTFLGQSRSRVFEKLNMMICKAL